MFQLRQRRNAPQAQDTKPDNEKRPISTDASKEWGFIGSRLILPRNTVPNCENTSQSSPHTEDDKIAEKCASTSTTSLAVVSPDNIALKHDTIDTGQDKIQDDSKLVFNIVKTLI